MKEKHLSPEELFGTEACFQYVKLKGKYYKMSERDGKSIFIEISKKEVDSQLKMARELAENLKDNLDASKVLVEIFMTRYGKKDLEKLYKYALKGKKKYKAKTREGYCVDMKIGNHIIPIVD